LIVIGSDHAGLALKARVRAYLEQQGEELQDVGVYEARSCDYPDYALAVARAVAGGAAERGVLVCGSGAGMAITANKVAGVRAVMCMTELQARLARAHNDVNVLCLGERLQGEALALAVVEQFLRTPFEGGRHAARLGKISAAEQGER